MSPTRQPCAPSSNPSPPRLCTRTPSPTSQPPPRKPSPTSPHSFRPRRPPTLHCVPLPQRLFDVENNDRSCLIGHDDDSAEVERVGKGAGYETLWGCCGKTVDGDGDMGPPDGWCYEGMHTTDPKRARFRADSTLHDDKLTSCARLRCHDPLGSATRKRTRRAVDADSEDSASDSDGASHSSVRTRSRTSKRARIAPEHCGSDSDDDVDMPGEPSSSLHASPKSTASARKPRARSVVSTASTRVKPAPKARKPRSTVQSADSPASPSRKPASRARFAPDVSTLGPAASFTSTLTSSTVTETATHTQTVVVTTPSAKPPSMKVKRAMQPKSKLKSKQPKRLDEVVESSIVGEIA
ncbi:hypothetical protein B0H17DRAFT_526459 [Mycena rosella]|uniref:Uncharacterized protein n=1 Tax=Mycena rosella TaxID=1033263 RepID=A0AAD7MA28_MYCRO|nr:hypothetical protein B0H17DRAFT_526459 [Mycena rosella]